MTQGPPGLASPAPGVPSAKGIADATASSPAVVSVHMGYGHQRAALALAEAARVPVLSLDRPPIAADGDVAVWNRTREAYDRLSRRTGVPVVGGAYRRVIETVTAIPRLAPPGALAGPNLAVRYMERLLRRGFGDGLVAHLRAAGVPLISTFYAAALAADAAMGEGPPIVSVLTDADVNRVWAPRHASAGRILYAVPTARAGRRLRAFGVPPERIHRTGFPIPDALVGAAGETTRRRALAARLVRLDPRGHVTDPAARALRNEADPREAIGPIEVVFAVGGAGAQVELAEPLLRAWAPRLRADAMRLTLVAGVREDTAARLRRAAMRAGLSAEGGPIEILLGASFDDYAHRFHARLASADVLVTKPSELTFFAAAGFSLAFTSPIGAQEWANRAWARRLAAIPDLGPLRRANDWLHARLADGALAASAFAAAARMPRHGTARILALAAGS